MKVMIIKRLIIVIIVFDLIIKLVITTMQTVHQCSHYQRKCIEFIIKVMQNHHVAKSTMLANYATMRSISSKRDVRLIAWSLIKQSISNALIASKSSSLGRSALSVRLNLGNIRVSNADCMRAILKKQEISFIAQLEQYSG